MRKLYFSLLMLICAFIQLQAQNVNVTATAGTPNGSYLTLKDAFDAINFGTHQGAITVTIVNSTIETTTATLNANSIPASYTSVNITTGGLISVSASIASSLINLSGATNVTINGNNQLTLINSVAGGNVLTLSNNASSNVIRNCTIQGITSSTTSGVIAIDSAATGNGADNNTFDNLIVDGQALAARLFYSQGKRGGVAEANTGDTIRNSQFRNVGTNLATPGFVWLGSGNRGWVIQNNNIYQASVNPFTVQGIVRGIVTLPNFTSDAHNIIGNFVGGNAAGATGTMQLTGSGSMALGFIGMDIETGGTGNIVQNNTVRNVSVTWSLTGGSFSNAGIFSYIGGYNGISTITRNNVSNLNFTNATGSALAYGIHCTGLVGAAGAVFPTFAITADTVDNITANAGGTGAVQMFGMRLETSSGASLTNTATSNPLFFVRGNVISNFSTTFSSSTTLLRGISNAAVQGSGSTAQLFPFAVIDSNLITNFTCPGTVGSYTSPTAVGVYFTGSTGGSNTVDVHDISANTINNLSSSSTADVNNTTTGMYFTNGIYNIYNNRIYDLKNKGNGSTNNPAIIGINLRAALDTSYIFNNFISLGNGETSNVQVFGIINNFATAAPINSYFNSIYITGTGSGGNTKRSAALLRGTETFGATITTPMDIVNNILYNVRTGGTGAHYAIANTHTTPTAGWATDSNNLYSTNPASIANWGGFDNDLTTYMTNASDAGSKSFTVNFVDPVNGNLHLTGASIGDVRLEGTPIPGITEDIDGQARNNDPYIGADEIPTSPLPVEMEFFTGRKQNTVNLLSWKASCTSSSITFEIERSADGRKFSTIGKITASQARCASPFDYTDASPSAGMNYYRLKMTEVDGSLKYSSIIAILNKTSGFELVGLYPTLVKSKATLSITAAKKTSLQVTVTDANGRRMLQQSMVVADGSALVNIDLSTLANGVYHLTGVTPDGYQKTIRFVKQ